MIRAMLITSQWNITSTGKDIESIQERMAYQKYQFYRLVKYFPLLAKLIRESGFFTQIAITRIAHDIKIKKILQSYNPKGIREKSKKNNSAGTYEI